MTERRGIFGVVEGSDGVGKKTQLDILVRRLRDEGAAVSVYDFPQYEKTLGGRLTGRFLAGEFGGIGEVSPYLACLSYAIDRWQAKPEIQADLDAGKIVLANRYALSNMGHQTSKLPSEKREEFLKFLNELEYGVFDIPKEDFNILLYLPAEKAQTLVDEKVEREYLNGAKRDIHEGDLSHLTAATQMYASLAERYPDRIVMIDCSDKDGNLMTPDKIHELVWQEVGARIDKLHAI